MKEQLFYFLSNLFYNEINIFLNYLNQYFDDEAFVLGTSNVFYIRSDLSMPIHCVHFLNLVRLVALF
jgi:hypothetical protein